MANSMIATTMAAGGDIGATKFIGDILKKVFTHGNSLKLNQIAWASLLPMAASGLWYLSRTTIVVTDSEQCLWEENAFWNYLALVWNSWPWLFQ